jgi:uncharacterized membrane protein YvlD (DUF360 family)
MLVTRPVRIALLTSSVLSAIATLGTLMYLNYLHIHVHHSLRDLLVMYSPSFFTSAFITYLAFWLCIVMPRGKEITVLKELLVTIALSVVYLCVTPLLHKIFSLDFIQLSIGWFGLMVSLYFYWCASLLFINEPIYFGTEKVWRQNIA